jgi:hypothetical protein
MRFPSWQSAERYLGYLGYEKQRHCLWFDKNGSPRGTLHEVVYEEGGYSISSWRLDGK